MIRQGLLSWSPCPHHPLSLPPFLCLQYPALVTRASKHSESISAVLNSVNEEPLTAKEKRLLRNERRQSKTTHNWREEVEQRLMKRKPKRRPTSWMDELNLDNLARLGPQWWVVRVSRVSGQYTAELLARSLARNFPTIDFKVYAPAVHVKRKLKNGSISVKPKPLFPGCIFLSCVMNKEIHDFIREFDGVGGFVGSKVGNTKRQINKPKPVDNSDMEEIFKKAKEEQEKADQSFEEEPKGEGSLGSKKLDIESHVPSEDVTESTVQLKPKRRSRKASLSLIDGSAMEGDDKLLIPGANVQVVSGAFSGFSGILKKLDRKTELATVGFTLFGKETLVDLNINEIVAEKNLCI